MQVVIVGRVALMNNIPANWNPRDTPRNPRRGSFKPVLITVGAAFLLLVGSFFGALSTCGSINSIPSPSFQFFSFCVYGSFAIFVLSLAWLLLSFFIWLFDKWRNAGG